MIEAATFQQIERLIAALKTKGQTLGTAESCTGGLLGAALTSLGGSSAVFVGSINAYSNDMKEAALAVPKALMVTHGAVSEPVALSMAQGMRAISRCDWAAGVTGVAGPGGGTPDKPVGLVCFALIGPNQYQKTWSHHIGGDRAGVRNGAVHAVATALSSTLVAGFD